MTIRFRQVRVNEDRKEVRPQQNTAIFPVPYPAIDTCISRRTRPLSIISLTPAGASPILE